MILVKMSSTRYNPMARAVPNRLSLVGTRQVTPRVSQVQTAQGVGKQNEDDLIDSFSNLIKCVEYLVFVIFGNEKNCELELNDDWMHV
jgi:hypothetical protein